MLPIGFISKARVYWLLQFAERPSLSNMAIAHGKGRNCHSMQNSF